MGHHHRPKQESGRQGGSQEAQTVRPDVPFPVMWKSHMGWLEEELEKAVGLEFHLKIMECWHVSYLSKTLVHLFILQTLYLINLFLFEPTDPSYFWVVCLLWVH